MTSVAEIQKWFERGKANGHTHMLVVCDTFDHDDYPVYLNDTIEARKRAAEYRNGVHSMQRLMEVYNLAMDMETQLKHPRNMEF